MGTSYLQGTIGLLKVMRVRLLLQPKHKSGVAGWMKSGVDVRTGARRRSSRVLFLVV